MIKMTKEIEKALMASKEIIDSTRNELDILQKSNSWVVLYFNEEEKDTFYGMTATDMNQISDGIKNIIPMPSKNNIKVMNHGSAEIALKRIPRILNGKGTMYDGKVVPYVAYVSMYLEIVEKNYKFITEMFG